MNTYDKRLSCLQGRRILVTGAGGFIGRYVLKWGFALGAELHALSLEPDVPGVAHHWQADLTDQGRIRSVVKELKPDSIIHLAAAGVAYGSGDLQRLLAVNVTGFVHLLEAAVALASPPAVICAGSGFEYAPKDGPLSEEDPIRPHSPYGVSKASAALVAELYARRLPLTVLRLFSIYGPGEPGPRLAPYIIEQARKRLPVELTAGAQRRDYAFVGDIAECFFRALAAPPDSDRLRILNVGSGREITLRAFAEALAMHLRRKGLDPTFSFGARPYRPDELMCYTADVRRLREVLQWTPPTTLNDGLRQMVEDRQ